MEYFAILTVELPGSAAVTATTTVIVTGRATRSEIYEHMRQSIAKEHGPRFAAANVAFFSAEPNSIGS